MVQTTREFFFTTPRMKPCQAASVQNKDNKKPPQFIGATDVWTEFKFRDRSIAFVGDRLVVPQMRYHLVGTSYGKKQLTGSSASGNLI